MKLYSWNVNGIRAVVKKDFGEILQALDPDVLGLQETKAQDDQVREALFGLDGTAGYEIYSSSAAKKGYSGTAILTKITPLSVQAGIGVEELDQEGRVCVQNRHLLFRNSITQILRLASSGCRSGSNGTRPFSNTSNGSMRKSPSW